MTDDSDIKELLGRALEDEPPIRIDRGEVFRQGRKRLRRRRILEAGSVVAGVVAVAVGAVIFTGAHHDQRGGIPAAAGDQPDPASPTPLVTPVPSEELAPPDAGGTPVATSEQHAWDMTVALIEFLPADLALEPMPSGADAEFTTDNGVYQLAADLIGPDAEGALHIAVAPAKADDQTDCVAYLAEYQECELVGTGAGEVAIATEQLGVGEWRYLAFVARPDGTAVTAAVSGLSERQRQAGDSPAREEPVLTRQVFARLALLPGLSYY